MRFKVAHRRKPSFGGNTLRILAPGKNFSKFLKILCFWHPKESKTIGTKLFWKITPFGPTANLIDLQHNPLVCLYYHQLCWCWCPVFLSICEFCCFRESSFLNTFVLWYFKVSSLLNKLSQFIVILFRWHFIFLYKIALTT